MCSPHFPQNPPLQRPAFASYSWAVPHPFPPESASIVRPAAPPQATFKRGTAKASYESTGALQHSDLSTFLKALFPSQQISACNLCPPVLM